MLHRISLLTLFVFAGLIAFVPTPGQWGLVRVDDKASQPGHEITPLTTDKQGVVVSAPVLAEAVGAALPIEEPDGFPTGVSLETALASYTTRYHTGGRHSGRAHNVETAAEKLDGAIIPAGGTLSFNTQVGPRDRASGFRRAMVIDGGELVPGMGGGVCQVASTLHAAALEGGLEMVQYRPHSRPSSYIPMGLDATVSYPQLDLEIENPFDFPVLVQSTASEGQMHVELIGQARPREVEIARRVLTRRRFAQRIVEDPTLDAGTRIVTQRGIRGARIERTRTVTENGETFVQREIVRYPPTDEIVRVGTAGAPAVHALEDMGVVGPLALR